MDDLIIKAQHGDDKAFYELLSLNRDKLYGTAMQYLRNESQALEAVQEVTCRVYLKLNTLKKPKYFSTWLVRVMINYCLDELRRQKRYAPLKDWDVTGSDDIDEQDVRIDMQNYVQKLKPKYRDTLVLRYYEDMSIEDIAAVTKKPVGTIKTWISRGLSQMRSMLKGREDYVSK